MGYENCRTWNMGHEKYENWNVDIKMWDIKCGIWKIVDNTYGICGITNKWYLNVRYWKIWDNNMWDMNCGIGRIWD